MAKVTGTTAPGPQVVPPPSESPAPESKLKLPAPPQRTLSIEQLLEYWNGIEQAMRPRLLGYLYRLWPIISRTPAYIDKLAEPPADPTAFLRTWGTGEYELMLTDLDKPKGGQLCKARFKFSQSYDEFPPVLDAIDLDVGRKENASYITWARSKGLLKMPGEQTSNAGNDAATAALAAGFQTLLAEVRSKKTDDSGMSAAVPKLSEMFAHANKASVDMVIAQAKQNDPEGLLKLFTGLLALIQPAKPAGDDSFMKFLLGELSAERQANRELMSKLLEPKQPHSPGNGLSQVRDMVETIGAMKEIFGAGTGTGSGQWWEMLAPHVGDLVSAAGKFGDALKFTAQRGAAQAAQTQPATGLTPGMPPDPMAQPAAPMPNPQPQETQMPVELMQFFQAAATPFLSFLRNNQRGDDLAAYLFEGGVLDGLSFEKIKAIGKDQILAMLKNSPAWALLSGAETRLIEFLDEFLAYDPAAPMPDVDEPPPPKGTPVQ